MEVGIVGGGIGGVDLGGPDLGEGGAVRIGGVEGFMDPGDIFSVCAGYDEGFGRW